MKRIISMNTSIITQMPVTLLIMKKKYCLETNVSLACNKTNHMHVWSTQQTGNSSGQIRQIFYYPETKYEMYNQYKLFLLFMCVSR